MNGCRDRLLGGILSADVHLRVVSDATFPSAIPSGRVLALTLHAEGLPGVQEIVYCTAISGDVLAVQRAREGTSARDWPVGTVVGAYFTAGMAEAFGGNEALDRLDVVEAFLAGVQAGANNYVHPASHPASMIDQDESHQFLTLTEKQQALQSIVLGETEQNAYRGDRGKQAYDHSRTAHAPVAAQKNSDILASEIFARIGAVSGRNRFVNGGMVFDQRHAGAALTIVAGAALAYCLDRWFAYCSGANVTAQQAQASDGTFRFRFTGAAGNTGIGCGQRVVAADTLGMYRQKCSLSAKVSCSVEAVLNWSLYRANSKDVFGTLANPLKTLVASGTWNVGPGEVLYTASVLQLPEEAVSGLEVVFSVAALGAGQTLSIGEAKMEPGEVSAFLYDAHPVLKLQCQRFFEKSFRYGTPPAPGVGTFEGAARVFMAARAGANVSVADVKFAVAKRADASIVVYNPINNNNQVRDSTAGGDCSSTSVSGTGDSSFFVSTIGNALTAVGNTLAFHWTAEAEV